MFNARDCALANYITDMLRRDLSRFGPGQPISWGWTLVLLWMAEEIESLAATLRTPEQTRLEMLDLGKLARQRVREVRRSVRHAA